MKLVLDPRTKMFILVLINVIVFLSPSLAAEGICMGSIALLAFAMGAYRQALRGLALYAVMMAALRLCGVFPGFLSAVVSMMVICFRKIAPLFVFSSVMIATTRVSELICALQKIHVPKSIIIPHTKTATR